MTAAFECIDVVKRFDGAPVLQGVSWRVEAGQIVALLGASGAGKTTLLRMIAGLSPCSSGRVELSRGRGGAETRVGMVFQNLALWPHLTARAHLECVLANRHRGERRRRAEGVLSGVRLPEATWLLRPDQLSGGEAQRLALARALAAEPEILLLDEPLAHLDDALKQELSTLIRDVTRSAGLTVVYVTHAWAEAVQLGSQIAVLESGRLVQSGDPAAVYFAPVNRTTALLAGPLVDLPLEWLAGGFVGRQVEDPAAVSILPIDRAICAVRCQQIRLIAPANANRWRVIASRPGPAGWLARLQNGDRVFELTLAAMPQDDETGLEALAVERLSLHSPLPCATSNDDQGLTSEDAAAAAERR